MSRESGNETMKLRPLGEACDWQLKIWIRVASARLMRNGSRVGAMCGGMYSWRMG